MSPQPYLLKPQSSSKKKVVSLTTLTVTEIYSPLLVLTIAFIEWFHIQTEKPPLSKCTVLMLSNLALKISLLSVKYSQRKISEYYDAWLTKVQKCISKHAIAFIDLVKFATISVDQQNILGNIHLSNVNQYRTQGFMIK